MNSVFFRKINDEVFVAQDAIVKIGPDEVAFIKAKAATNGRQRARICAHKSNDDQLHEMVIAISSQSYIHPHKHEGKSESFHVIEGAADVVVFDDNGAVTDVVELGDPTTGRFFFYRLDKNACHTLLIKTKFFVVHEITNGPFVPEKTLLASWAPCEGRIAETNVYIKSVAELVRKYKLAADQSGH